MSLLTDLVAHWKLDEASGTRFDSHGANDLSDNNAPLSSGGKLGDAAEFIRASSQYLSTTSSQIATSDGSDWAVAFWFFRADTAATHRLVVFNASNLIIRAISGGGTLQVIAGGSFLNVLSVAGAGAWHFVILQWRASSNDFRIVVDGVASTLTPAGALSTNSGLTLSHSTDPLNGLMDSVSFWSRQLSADEETALWNGHDGLDYENFGGGGGATHELAGASSGSTTVSAALSVTKTLAGGAAGSTTVTAALSVSKPLAAQVTASTVTAGALSVEKSIAGSISGTTTVSGALSVAKNLAGSAAGSTVITVTLFEQVTDRLPPWLRLPLTSRRVDHVLTSELAPGELTSELEHGALSSKEVS